MAGYGYIAHDAINLWFEGPLPSPRVARLLVMLNQGLNDHAITSEDKLSLQRKWRFVAGPPSLASVEWAIDLDSVYHRSEGVAKTLQQIRDAGIRVYHDAGPNYPETP